MHQDEIWQTYSCNGEPARGGGPSLTDEPKNDAGVIGVAIVLLYRRNESDLEFLWQKRSAKTKRYPGLYDLSAGGHINFGESAIIAAIQEAHEELGVTLREEEMGFVTTKWSNLNKLAWLYAVDWNGKPCDFHYNDGEVATVEWVPYPEMQKFRKKFTKDSIKNADALFAALDEWVRMRGLVV